MNMFFALGAFFSRIVSQSPSVMIHENDAPRVPGQERIHDAIIEKVYCFCKQNYNTILQINP